MFLRKACDSNVTTSPPTLLQHQAGIADQEETKSAFNKVFILESVKQKSIGKIFAISKIKVWVYGIYVEGSKIFFEIDSNEKNQAFL